MKLYIIFAQAKCSYEGQYAPEAIHIMDEISYDGNPSWIYEKLEEVRNDAFYEFAEIICIEVPMNKIQEILKNEIKTIKGVIGES
jgi:hypothetical protein